MRFLYGGFRFLYMMDRIAWMAQQRRQRKRVKRGQVPVYFDRYGRPYVLIKIKQPHYTQPHRRQRDFEVML